MRLGAEVYVIMSKAASRLIHPKFMEWATGNPVVTRLTGNIEHIALAGEGEGKVDLVLVAPATANTVSKAAHGICDTAVTAVVASALGSRIPVVLVPSMHASLYKNPAFQRSLALLKEMGVEVVEPRWEEGKAKIPPITEVVEKVVDLLERRDQFKGLKFLVTAGPTLEPLDMVRYLTNPSSGKMGFALVEEAWRRGGQVTLIKGPTNSTYNPPPGVKAVEVVTTKEMYDAVDEEISKNSYDIIILAAAPLDYGFSHTYPYKIPSGTSTLEVKLEPRPKISMSIRKLAPKAFFIGFKAEYGVSDEELVKKAYERLEEADMDLIVANDLSRKGCGFRHDTNEVFIIDRECRIVHVPLSSKREVAKAILDIAAERMRLKG